MPVRVADHAILAAWGRSNTTAGTALAVGMSESQTRKRLRALGISADMAQPAAPRDEFHITPLPDEDIPIEDLVAHRIKQFKKKAAHREAAKLIRCDVNIEGPIGLLVFGDPHVDDDGCDLETLRAHSDLTQTPGVWGCNIGDTTNNWVGRLARLYAEQGTSAKQAWALAEWFVKRTRWLFMIGGNHDCLDMETEALTRRGWRRYDEIADDDEVLSMIPGTDCCEWTPIVRRIKRANAEKMVAIEARTISARMTPNHRVLHRKRNWLRQWSSLKFAPATDLPTRFSLPLAARSGRPEHDLSDDWITLAGWLLTDGGIQPGRAGTPRVTFYQSKPDAGLEATLAALGLAHRTVTRTREITHVCGRELVQPPLPQREYRLSAAAARRVLAVVPEKGRLPDWVFDLSDRQFDVLLAALIAGDGSYATSGSGSAATLYGGKTFLDSVQAGAVAHGWRAFLSLARENEWRLNLCRRIEWEAERGKVVSEDVAAPEVWCLTVPHGNFMVRRNGKPHFTGNCWSGAGDPLQWICRQQDALYQSSEVRMGLDFPNGRQIIVNARHDFAGHSQWNPAHGVMKAATMGVRDHVLVCGHKHVSGYAVLKDPDSGRAIHTLQVATYKVYDRYAVERGFRDQNLSPAAFLVIDPALPEAHPDLVKLFWDPVEGVKYLNWRRSQS